MAITVCSPIILPKRRIDRESGRVRSSCSKCRGNNSGASQIGLTYHMLKITYNTIILYTLILSNKENH